jgi:hypothetical protein
MLRNQRADSPDSRVGRCKLRRRIRGIFANPPIAARYFRVGAGLRHPSKTSARSFNKKTL